MRELLVMMEILQLILMYMIHHDDHVNVYEHVQRYEHHVMMV